MAMPSIPANPLDKLLGYRFRRASASLMAELARDLAALELTPTEASILLLIDANPGLTQSDVGRMLGIKRANMAPLTRTLDERALVQRERVDGRSQGLAVTEAGALLCRAAKAAMETHDARLLARIPVPARGGLLAALAALLEAPGEE